MAIQPTNSRTRKSARISSREPTLILRLPGMLFRLLTYISSRIRLRRMTALAEYAGCLPYPKVQNGHCATPVAAFQLVDNRAATAAFAIAMRREDQNGCFMLRIESDFAQS